MPDDLKKTKAAKRIPTLTVDWQAYGHFLEGSDLSEEDKREFIETMWSIVIGFVDLGFAVRSPDQGCGQDVDADAAEPGDMVHSLVNHWNNATEDSGVEQSGPRPRGRTP